MPTNQSQSGGHLLSRAQTFQCLLVGPGGVQLGIVGKESSCNAGAFSSSLSQDDPLEKEMATHSSILAWEIPRTEEPGGLQSTGLPRVRPTNSNKTNRHFSPPTVVVVWLVWEGWSVLGGLPGDTKRGFRVFTNRTHVFHWFHGQYCCALAKSWFCRIPWGRERSFRVDRAT